MRDVYIMKNGWLRAFMRNSPYLFHKVFVRGQNDAQKLAERFNHKAFSDLIAQAKNTGRMSDEAIAYYETRIAELRKSKK